MKEPEEDEIRSPTPDPAAQKRDDPLIGELLGIIKDSHKKSLKLLERQLKSLKEQLKNEIETNRRRMRWSWIVNVLGVVLAALALGIGLLGAFGIWPNF